MEVLLPLLIAEGDRASHHTNNAHSQVHTAFHLEINTSGSHPSTPQKNYGMCKSA